MEVKALGSNQTLIVKSDKEILVSYETPVAAFIQGRGYFCTEKYFSKTTSKHINSWLSGAKAQIKPQEFFDNLLK